MNQPAIFRRGKVHRASLPCGMCQGSVGGDCFACKGEGSVRVGCGGEVEESQYGEVYCLNCHMFVRPEETSQ